MISDTTPEIERMVLELRRKQSSGQRLSNALEMSEFMRSLEIGVLRADNPGRSEVEILYLLAVKRYGRELATRAFGSRLD